MGEGFSADVDVFYEGNAIVENVRDAGDVGHDVGGDAIEGEDAPLVGAGFLVD